MKHKFASQIVVLFTLLALMFSVMGVAPAKAAGPYTHTWFVGQAITILSSLGGYSELVDILNRNVAYSNYGSIFPDYLVTVDGTWADTYGHDVNPIMGNGHSYVNYQNANGYTWNDSNLQQASHYKAFLADSTYPAVLPPFRAALMRQMLARFRHSPRTAEDEQMIAFLFGYIAHQEADNFWHFDINGTTSLENTAVAGGWNRTIYELDFDKNLYHYNSGHLVVFDFYPTIKPVMEAAAVGVGSSPTCFLCDPWWNGHIAMQAGWGLATEDGGVDDDLYNFITGYSPGGVYDGSALVAGAWMRTWDMLSNTTYYVKPVASGTGDCFSWENACTLQTALNLPYLGGSNEIWVMQGTYKPTSGTDRAATFQLKNGVAVYGGFAGNETARDQRNPAANLTILSGDIDNNDSQTPIITDIDTVTGNGTNSYHVVTGAIGAIGPMLDGFTVTAGNANVGTWPETTSGGGGMFNALSSPTITNVIFSGNSAEAGGGMLNYGNSSPTITNVTFSGNLATSTGGGMNNYQSSPTLANVTFSGNSAQAGGGMINNASSPSLTNVTFSANEATTASGGGMFNYSSSNPTVTNVTFSANSAVYGGGMLNENNSSPTLTSVTFGGNSASYGGGMYNKHGNPTLTNVTFNGNSASFNGGGMYNEYGNTVLTNVTFGSNSASWTGDGMYNEYSSPLIRNTIMWGDGGDEIRNVLSSTPTVEDSVVEGGYASGTNIITADPKLGALGDYGGLTPTILLLSGSSAIDAGDDATCPATDQRGVARPQGEHCDIGAFEAEFFTLDITSDHGTVTKNPDQATYHEGDVIQLTATPDADWEFVSWTGDVISDTNLVSLTIAGSTGVTANYRPINHAPSNITLSNSLIAENKPVATLVGLFTTIDQDAGSTFTYSFTCAVPGANDNSFTISGSSLKTAAVFDYETKQNYSICIRSTDQGGLSFDKNFTISVTDVNEPLLKNGGFNTYTGVSKIPTSWIAANFAATDGKDSVNRKEGTASVKIIGLTGKIKSLSQTILVSGIKGDTFTLSFWMKGTSIPTTGICQAQVLFYNGTLSTGNKTIPCSTGTYAWKQIIQNFVSPGAYNKVVVKITYAKATGTIWFDLFKLAR